MTISPRRRQEIIDSLRRGTVPVASLDAFAVGLEKFEDAITEELKRVSEGGSVFKAVRGEYGCGKTFFARWLADRARKMGFASSEVQISETETPLHKVETVYRRLLENLATSGTPTRAWRSVVDGWFYALEEDALAEGQIDPQDEEALLRRTDELLEQRLAEVTRSTPAFGAALRGYRRAIASGDGQLAEGVLAWLAGQPNIAAATKRAGGIQGSLDHYGALSFLQGVLTMLRDAGHPGLLLVLDEVETLQRVRTDVRDKGLNALRQLIDEVDSNRFPGLYLVVTGTTAFFEGPQGVRRLEPLAQRLQVDFQTDARFDNPRAAQIRLPAFDLERLHRVGVKVRDIFAASSSTPDRIQSVCDDRFVEDLANATAGSLGGKVGVAPRIFLKKLVGDVLDRVDQFPDFDPRKDYQLTLVDSELSPAERASRDANSVDEIELDL